VQCVEIYLQCIDGDIAFSAGNATFTQTIADLRAQTSANGGYSLATSMPITRWATETAARAGSLMVIVPILTSLLLKWAFPRVGQAISGMLMAARGIGGNIQASTAGIVPASHDRMLGLEHNEMRDAMADYGRRSLAMRKAFNDWDKLHHNNRWGWVLGGHQPWITPQRE